LDEALVPWWNWGTTWNFHFGVVFWEPPVFWGIVVLGNHHFLGDIVVDFDGDVMVLLRG
jgi:hypothetical protein